MFLSPIQRGLSATYAAPILTAFEIEDVNRCPHAYTGEKFSSSCTGSFTCPQTAENEYFRGVFMIRLGLQLKRHNFGQWESFR